MQGMAFPTYIVLVREYCPSYPALRGNKPAAVRGLTMDKEGILNTVI